MALRIPWDSTVEGVQRASTLRPEAPARTPFSPMVERLAPAPNDPRFHGDGRYGGTPNPPNPTSPQPAAATPSPAAAAGTAEAPAAEAVKKGGWFRRAASVANTLRDAPGKAVGLLDADIMPALRAVPGKVAAAANSTLGRAALPVSVGMSALESADTSTAEYERRTGLRGGDMPSDLGVRTAGVTQDLGNNLTFGVADRVGNLIAGNGFNRSVGNQVGELFGPGREVGGAPQSLAPAPTTSANPNQTGDTLRRLGITPNEQAGAGRGAGAQPPTAGEVLRQSVDMSKFLASGGNKGTLPTDLSSLTPGNVYKTVDPKTGRPIYSGTNVKENAPMVDARGGFIKNLSNDLRGEGAISVDPGTGRSDGGGIATASGSLPGYGKGYGPGSPAAQAYSPEKLHALRTWDAHKDAPTPGIIGIDGGGSGGFGIGGGGGGSGGFGPSSGSGNMKPRDIRAANALASAENIASMRERGERASQNNSLRVAEMNNAAQRYNNDQNNRIAQRGHELTYEGHMAPLRLAESRRQLAAAYVAKFPDPAVAAQAALMRGDTDVAEHLSKGVTTMQGQAAEGNKLIDAKYDEVKTGMKGRFNFMDKEGQPKMSDAMEAQAYTRFRSANPDYHNEPDQAKRQRMLRNHLGDEELAARFGDPKNGGYAGLVPGFLSPNRPMLRQNGIPGDDLLVNGKIDTPYQGARLSPDIQSGDRFYDPGPGKSAVNMKDLSADALQRLNFHIQAAKQRAAEQRGADRLRN